MGSNPHLLSFGRLDYLVFELCSFVWYTPPIRDYTNRESAYDTLSHISLLSYSSVLVEQHTVNVKVTGSKPVGTAIWNDNSVGRVLD